MNEAKEALAAFATFLGICCYFVFLLAVASAAEGFVLMYLWEWFVTPFGLPAIDLLHAMGLGLIVSFLTYHFYPIKEDDPGIGARLQHLLLRPVVTFALGWSIHYFS